MAMIRAAVARCAAAALAACLVMEQASAQSFWTQPTTDLSDLEARELPGMAYCEALDVMLVAFGAGANETILNDLALYDFASQTFASFTLPDEVIPRFGPSVVSIEAPLAAADSCRFLLWGGSFNYVDNLQDPFEDVVSDSLVWAIDVLSVSAGGEIIVNATEVQVSNPLLGRLGATVSVRNNSMVVVSGQEALENGEDASYPANDLWRLTLDTNAPADAPAGNWTQIADSLTNRFYSGATWSNDGQSLVMHGGQGRVFDTSNNPRDIARSDISVVSSPSLFTEDVASLEITSDRVQQSNVLYRLHHIMGHVGDTIFIFGGLQFVQTSSGGTVLQANPFLALTTIDFDLFTSSCELADGSVVAWCGLTEEFPGTSKLVSGTQRGDELVVLRQVRNQNGTLDNELWSLDMAAVLTEGKQFLKNGYTLEGWGGTDAGLKGYFALQFSLVIVAIVGVCAIGIIHRSRMRSDSSFANAFTDRRSRSYGVPKEVVNALPWIRYDVDGHHVRLRREVDEDGNETFTEIPGSDIIVKKASIGSNASISHTPQSGISIEVSRPEADVVDHRAEHNCDRRPSEIIDDDHLDKTQESDTNADANEIDIEDDGEVTDTDGGEQTDDEDKQENDDKKSDIGRTNSASSEATILVERISSKLSELSERVPSLISAGSRRLSRLSNLSRESGAGLAATGQPGISGATFNFMDEEEGDLCSICLLEFEQGEPIKQLPCNHFFHGDCIEPWLLKRGDCPLCKRHIITLRTIEEEEALREASPDSYVSQAYTEREARASGIGTNDMESQRPGSDNMSDPAASSAAVAAGASSRPPAWRRLATFVTGSNSLRPELPFRRHESRQ
ncbi:E3 ubiquitin-protein ligase RNF181 [Hondaea fermentalgiana]|uniref:E3 ubiquitin-protein ligase RNF181 n=1 Tax=Hondaea fermentalgiana TaxID=2315210 RepID=A0A2R5GNM4_9STRA|nr:E3 ubiquitin-protein ligase RNF181 [Hondaea fermentalgiana]|eukprot:GBG30223.1 E3 ubiquitin-protein ligase RNF181 [Hondaea fermentalgiana]